MIVWTEAGEALALRAWLGLETVQPWLLHLFTNDHEPGKGDTLVSYREASFPGYQPLPLPGWQLEGKGASHPACVFTRQGGGSTVTAQGYYLTSGSTLLGGERFPESVSLARLHDWIEVELELEP